MTTANTGIKTISINGPGNTSIGGILSNGSGTLALTKNGTGTLTLSGGPHTYGGPTLVSGGTLVNSSIGGSAATTATLTVGNVPGTPAILDIVPGANVTNYTLAIGTSANGAVFQSGGTFTQVQGANIADFRIGDGTGGYGYYQLSGGTLNANEIGVGGGNGGNATIGVMDITGGTFYDAGWITVGRGGTSEFRHSQCFRRRLDRVRRNSGRLKNQFQLGHRRRAFGHQHFQRRLHSWAREHCLCAGFGDRQ